MIKENANLIDLDLIVKRSNKLEKQIIELKEKESIEGSDFIPLILAFDEIKDTVKGIAGLIDKISEIHQNFRPKRNYESNMFIKSLKNNIELFAGDLNKKINFNHDRFDISQIPYQHRLSIKDILVQLIRDSIYHRIENPEERLRSNKTEDGNIEISTFVNDNSCIIKYRDDGRGIQLEKLLEMASSQSKFKDSELNNWDDSQAAQLIFEPSFTTLKKATNLGGRGIGLDLIKKKLTQYRGTIQVNFETGKFTEFVVTIPVKQSKKSRVSKKINFENIEL